MDEECSALFFNVSKVIRMATPYTMVVRAALRPILDKLRLSLFKADPVVALVLGTLGVGGSLYHCCVTPRKGPSSWFGKRIFPLLKDGR